MQRLAASEVIRVAPDRACDLCSEFEVTPVLDLGCRVLLRCIGCGLVRLHPRPTENELREVYDTGDYYTHEFPRLGRGRSERIRNAVLDCYWGYPSSRSFLAKTLLTLVLRPLKGRVMPVEFPQDAPVLDVGCGNGQRLLELEDRGCNHLYGIEPTRCAAEVAQQGTSAKIFAGLLEDAQLPLNHFQLVIMNQVLEHVPSPTQTLALVRRLMSPMGALYLTVPNFDSWEAGWFGRSWSGLQVPAHLHHFTPGPLRRLIEEAGFQITTWRTDTVLSVTAASLVDWQLAKPSWIRNLVQAVPRLAYLPLTLVGDAIGRGQMLRIVARAR